VSGGRYGDLSSGVLRFNFDRQEEVEELLQWIVLVKCTLKKRATFVFIALARLTPAASSLNRPGFVGGYLI
jgi:hypothetical protein